MSVETALAVLRISRKTWNTIPKKDRERIIDAVKKGTFGKAREIANVVLKRKAKSKRKRKTKTRSKKRRRKKRSNWWE